MANEFNFARAFLKMQSAMPTVTKSREAYNFKYAPYEHIWAIVRECVTGNGFAVTHHCDFDAVAGLGWVESDLIFADSGEKRSSRYTFDVKAKDQERGKSITYGKRYNLAALLGLAIEGEPDRDDDRPTNAGGSSVGGSDF